MFKTLIINVICACVIGALSAFLKIYLGLGNSSVIGRVTGGVIGGVSAAIMVRMQRNDIKDFIKHQYQNRTKRSFCFI